MMNNHEFEAVSVTSSYFPFWMVAPKESIFPEWPLKLYLFGNIFENDQVRSFSRLVIITLMGNRLNRVGQILQWKAHYGNNNKKSQSYADWYWCRTPWQVTNSGWSMYLKKMPKNYFRLLWNTTQHSLASSFIPFSYSRINISFLIQIKTMKRTIGCG